MDYKQFNYIIFFNKLENKRDEKIYIFMVQQRYIYVNKWNTIIGVGYYYDDLSDSTRVLLEDTAIEIANRVDALSESL